MGNSGLLLQEKPQSRKCLVLGFDTGKTSSHKKNEPCGSSRPYTEITHQGIRLPCQEEVLAESGLRTTLVVM